MDAIMNFTLTNESAKAAQAFFLNGVRYVSQASAEDATTSIIQKTTIEITILLAAAVFIPLARQAWDRVSPRFREARERRELVRYNAFCEKIRAEKAEQKRVAALNLQSPWNGDVELQGRMRSPERGLVQLKIECLVERYGEGDWEEVARRMLREEREEREERRELLKEEREMLEKEERWFC